VLDISNILYRATMIPLYDTLGPETISFVIGHSNIETLFIEKSAFTNLWKAKELFNLKTIV
jgi:long-chain acyl-CoA synthetase